MKRSKLLEKLDRMRLQRPRLLTIAIRAQEAAAREATMARQAAGDEAWARYALHRERGAAGVQPWAADACRRARCAVDDLQKLDGAIAAAEAVLWPKQAGVSRS